VQLYEEYPARCAADVNRRYRWIRGDWQLASWLLPQVPGPDGERRDNPLSVLSRSKLFDNLRRSLARLRLFDPGFRDFRPRSTPRSRVSI